MDSIQTGLKLLIVEGNIGSGKSTFLRILNKYLNINPIFEPCKQWQEIGGDHGNLLEEFYKDMPRWAYTFQTYAFISRVIEQESNIRKHPFSTHIIERSVYSDRYCFAKNCFEKGLMNDLEWELYRKWFSWLVENYTVIPSGFIYLRAEPKTSYNRLLKRSRAEELTIKLDYLESLCEKHEDWLVKKIDIADYLKNVPVLILDCNKEFEVDQQKQLTLVAEVASFFKLNYLPSHEKQDSSSLSL